MNVRPLNNIVIIERDAKPNASSGGIALPYLDNKVVRTGTVLAVGPGVHDENGKLIPVGVNVGDRIAFDKSVVKDFDVNGDIVTMVKGNGIYGIIPPTQ